MSYWICHALKARPESTPSSRGVACVKIRVRRVHELRSRISSGDDQADERLADSQVDTLGQHVYFERCMILDDLERLLDPRLDPRDCERTILAGDFEGHQDTFADMMSTKS